MSIINPSDALHQFRDAMLEHGLLPPTRLITDGQIHRCDVKKSSDGWRHRSGNDAGAYVLHLDARIPHGGFQNWTNQRGWQSWRPNLRRELTAAEQREISEAMEKARSEHARYQAKVRAEARVKARHMWDDAEKASASHGYCERKQVEPIGLRMMTWRDGTTSLVVPLYNEDEKITSLEFIDADGRKRFLKDGRVQGCHYWIAAPGEIKIDRKMIYLAEGWATGESIYQATRDLTVIAFNAGNLCAVAEWLRQRYPEHKIVVCADDDWKTDGNPGLHYANKAARAVNALVAIPKFGDDRAETDTDFNDMDRALGLDAVEDALDGAVAPEAPPADQTDDEEKAKQQKQVMALLSLTPSPPGGGLFHTKDYVGYADIMVKDHRETWKIRSTFFKQWMTHQFFQLTGGPPSAQPLKEAIDAIEARANFDKGAVEREVCLRVGAHNGKLYLDLCDKEWRVVEIDADGWRVVNNPPVRFRRVKGMLPLPVPQRGGSMERLRPFINVKADDGEEKQITDSGFVLLVSAMLAALRPTGPYPILKFYGEPGSAKSTTTEIFRRLTDPHKVIRRRLPREDRDLFIAANNSHVLSYDNVSELKDWLSDSLCALATGGGFATRTLYTDEDEQLFDATRPIILNGVENFRTRHDLADRAIGMEFQPIPKQQRRLEKELWAKFDAEWPAILGALLDMAAHGLQMLPQTKSEDWPRLADFAQWATACETALWDAGTFRDAYAMNREQTTLSAIDDDAVAAALIGLMGDERQIEREGGKRVWTGTTTELLQTLTSRVDDKQAKSKEWPTVARALTSCLERAKATLRQVGITIDHSRGRGKGRLLIITAPLIEPAERPSPPSRPSFSRDYKKLDEDGHEEGRPDRPSYAKPLKNKQRDDRDAKDGRPGDRGRRRPFDYQEAGEDDFEATASMPSRRKRDDE